EAPVTTAAPAAVAPPALPAPAPDPSTQITFAFADASPCTNGQFDVRGAVTNQSGATYTIAYTITVFAADGSPAGTASATTEHLGPNGRAMFDPTGSCSQAIAPRPPSAHITNVTPG